MDGVATTPAQQRVRTRLAGLFPDIGPWTSAALWQGRQALPPPPTTPLADELDVICQRRLAGLLLRYLRDAQVEVAPEHLATLQRFAFQLTSMGMRAGHAAGPVFTAIERLGVPVAVSKGPGIAQFYPSLDCRPYSDIDLVVEPRHFRSVVSALHDSGWREDDRNVQPRSFMTFHCREGLNLHGADGGSIDVHHRVPPWIWSTGLEPAAMVARAEAVDLAGTTFRCLTPADNLLVVALHLISDRNAPGQSLIVWRDLVELAHAVPTADAVAAAERSGLSGWLRAVLQALPAGLDVRGLVAALPDRPVAHPRRLALLLSERASGLGVVATQSLRLPARNAAQFVAGMAVPSSSFLSAKYPDEPHPFRRWWAHSSHRPAR